MSTESTQIAGEAPIASPQDAIIDTLTIGQQEALLAIEATGQAVAEGFSRAQREIAEFVAERIRQDMETQQEFLRCRSLDDVRGVQTRFLRTAMDQYSSEASRLMQLGNEIVARSVARDRA